MATGVKGVGLASRVGDMLVDAQTICVLPKLMSFSGHLRLDRSFGERILDSNDTRKPYEPHLPWNLGTAMDDR